MHFACFFSRSATNAKNHFLSFFNKLLAFWCGYVVGAQDIKHIEHALTKLKPGGRLVAICANGPRQREALQPLALEWIDLPAGSFQEAGTNVNAAIVVIER